MFTNEADVLRYVEENDVKFIRMSFCDIHGNVKNLSVIDSELAMAFRDGVPISGEAIDGFMGAEDSYLRLFPDPKTLTVMPWRPQRGKVIRLFCDIKRADGSPYEYDVRRTLKNTAKKLAEYGIGCSVGIESEFYLFEADQNGDPTRIPQDKAGYFDIAPLDKGENVRREICLSLEEMGLKPISSHHEKGPGQNEIDFRRRNAFKAAENCVLFKSTVQTIAASNGLFASFYPKPLADHCGNGLAFKLMLTKDGVQDVMGENGSITDTAAAFAAGILDRAAEITCFTNPSVASFDRLSGDDAPSYIGWSRGNHGQCIRLTSSSADAADIEVRWPDATCNPFLALTLIIEAGLEGIKMSKTLPVPFDAANADNFARLPHDLETAIRLSKESQFVRSALTAGLADSYISASQREWERFSAYPDKAGYLDKVFKAL